MNAYVFDETHYRAAIKTRVKRLRETRRGLSFLKIAEKIGVQSTFLSRALNREDVHLNEDHFFSILQFLGFNEHETDFLFVLRALEMTTDQKRKTYLVQKVEKLRLQYSLTVTESELGKIKASDELSYLLNPLGILVYVALHLRKFLEKPLLLTTALGISEEKLKEIFQQLKGLGYIELGTRPFQVEKLVRIPLHYSKDHPLMRAHQHLLKTLCTAQLLKLAETDKTNFMVTFTGSPEAFEEVQKEFLRFLERVQKLSQGKNHEEMYQMNFDLFKWVKS